MKNLHIDQLLSAKTAKIPIGENRTVFDAILSTGDPAVLAMITAVEGPSYRPVGAAMALFPQTGSSVGSLSSGCIEGDLMHHAKACAQTGKGRTVRYGIGSPFMDIKLPCGGGLEVTLIPNPPTAELLALTSAIEARRPLKITINADEGTFDKKGGVHICYEPDIHFSVFGSGAEASVFTNLATAAGYSAKLWSPDGADDARLR
ncbi:MAG: XdhC family protein, partial [Pseudomonadota bacterium]